MTVSYNLHRNDPVVSQYKCPWAIKTLIHTGLLFSCWAIAGFPTTAAAFADADENRIEESFVVAQKRSITVSAPSSRQGQGDTAQSLVDPGTIIYNVDGDKPAGWRGSPLISKEKIKQTGFILPFTSFEGTIIDNLNHREGISPKDVVFIDIKNGNWAKGDRFKILSTKRLIRHPVHLSPEKEKLPFSKRLKGEPNLDLKTPLGVPLGNLVEVVGVLEIVEKGENMSKAVILEGYKTIRNGDILIPYVQATYPRTRGESLNKPDREGYLVAFLDEKHAVGLGDILFIDLGRDHNVIPGDRFEIFITAYQTLPQKWNELNPVKVPLMNHVIGELQIVSVERETATALVTESTRALEIGHQVRFKPRTEPIQLAKLNALNQAPDYGPASSMADRQQSAETSAKSGTVGESEISEETEESPFPMAGLQEAFGKQDLENKLMTFRPTTALADIHFPFDRYDLDEEAKEILKKNAEYLTQHPNVKIQIQGHTDERGTNNYNLALGARRTDAIKVYLISLGVEEDRMYIISYGEEKPFCMETSENCWDQNRRAHFMVAEEDKDRF